MAIVCFNFNAILASDIFPYTFAFRRCFTDGDVIVTGVAGSEEACGGGETAVSGRSRQPQEMSASSAMTRPAR